MSQQPTSPQKPKSTSVGSTVSRYVSFVMLVVTILVCGFFFYNVIKGFILPLFLAALLAVIFRPLHDWIKGRCAERAALAATLSTASIMLIVLLPLAGLAAIGFYEANQIVRSRNEYLGKVDGIRRSLGLQKPFIMQLEAIESELRKLDVVSSDSIAQDASYVNSVVTASQAKIRDSLQQLKVEARDTVTRQLSDYSADMIRLLNEIEVLESQLQQATATAEAGQAVDSTSNAFGTANPDVAALSTELSDRRAELTERFDGNESKSQLAIEIRKLKTQLTGEVGQPNSDFVDTHELTPEKRSLRRLLKRKSGRAEFGFLELVDTFAAKLEAIPQLASGGSAVSDSTRSMTSFELRQAIIDAQFEYDVLRTALLGPIWKWVLELANPSHDQINERLSKLFAGGAARWLPSITNTATSLITGLLVGLAIMSVALFYFFVDGAKMINTFMHLSPLDDRHEMELLQEFDKVSRAVVLATLLSAGAQGVLGGIGYKIVGLDSVFLLTLLTAVLALIPFVGAAAIWLPCCLYLAFIKEPADPDGVRTWLYIKAGFLFAYGVGIVSMADNIIKPWVLQGQSKLHPLLALLSVLGGVQALGPIGILVGPMVVAFLQVLLTILQREIISLDEEINQAGQ